MEGAKLKLRAEDGDDLQIISAAAQDGLVRVKDLKFDKKARRFSARMDRFRWEGAASGPYERIASILSFEDVIGVRTKRLRTDAPEALAAILSVHFQPAAEPPGGEVRITLAAGGEIALEVECLDAALIDFGAPWMTPRRPDHETDA